jgi:hypothetical protein
MISRRPVVEFHRTEAVVTMGFHPADSPVPRENRTERLILRPLRVADAELDYDAVRSSAAQLRRWSDSTWPTDDFTLADNRADLVRHEREHDNRTAFTYTVLNPEEAQCLGCVYILPVWPAAEPLCAGAAFAAAVGFWVRASESASGLDRHLLVTLRTWLRADWAFDCILFTANLRDAYLAALLGETGLQQLPLTWPDGRRGLAFRDVLHPPD